MVEGNEWDPAMARLAFREISLTNNGKPGHQATGVREGNEERSELSGGGELCRDKKETQSKDKKKGFDKQKVPSNFAILQREKGI